jgi:hypothetical protein
MGLRADRPVDGREDSPGAHQAREPVPVHDAARLHGRARDRAHLVDGGDLVIIDILDMKESRVNKLDLEEKFIERDEEEGMIVTIEAFYIFNLTPNIYTIGVGTHEIQLNRRPKRRLRGHGYPQQGGDIDAQLSNLGQYCN